MADVDQDSSSSTTPRWRHYIQQVFMERMWDLYKNIFKNSFTAYFFIFAHRNFLESGMPILMTEGILYTVYYYMRTYDFPGGFVLLFLKFLMAYMIYHLPKIMWAAVFAMTSLLTLYPAYYNLVHSYSLKLAFVSVFKAYFNYYPPNCSLIVWFMCCDAFTLFFWNYKRDRRDWPLAAIFLGIVVGIYNNRLEMNDVGLLAFLLNLWMYLKSLHYPRLSTWMRPNPVLLFSDPDS